MGHQRAQVVNRKTRTRWSMNIKIQQCNYDGENAVAEGLEPGLIHFKLPIADVTALRRPRTLRSPTR